MKIETSHAVLPKPPMRTQALIGGKWRDATDGRDRPVFDPATGAEIARVPELGIADVDEAVRNARATFESPQWRDMLPAVRERLLLKLADLVEQNADDLANLETLNQGMSLGIARAVDVGASAQWLRYMAGWATKIEGAALDISFPFPPGTKYQVIVKRQPIGVVGAIVPWNFPLLMAIWKIAPALACGCTVVLKPAEDTPLTSLRLAELALEAGFPPGALNVITGDGKVGSALVRHPGISKISFTGSTEVGKLIGQQCAADVRRVTLELGGKSPVIVLDDCDSEVAIGAACSAIFFNSGQVCTAGSRLYVPRSLFERVVKGVGDAAGAMVLGSGFDPSTQIGPLVSKHHRERVLGLIETGNKEGATLLAGGTAPDGLGYFVRPTVFANPDKRPLTLIREEVFGPVLVAEPYDDLDDAVRRANDSSFGLSASVWTSNLSKALRIADRFEAGAVWINSHNVVDPNMPFGGMKQSGIGREHGRSAIESYTESKSICIAY